MREHLGVDVAAAEDNEHGTALGEVFAVAEENSEGAGAAGFDDELQVVEGEGHRIHELVVRCGEAAFETALVDLEWQDAGFGR